MGIGPGELVIDDNNAHLFTDPNLTVDGERKARGLILRNYNTHPHCYSADSGPFESLSIPLIPRDEWPERIREMEATKSRLSDIRRSSGPNGGHIPSLDQGSQGYCLVPGTMVRLSDGGEKPVDLFTGGELVVTHTGRTRKVVRPTKRQYTGKLITVSPADMRAGREVTATACHPFLTPAGEWKRLDEIGPRGGAVFAGRSCQLNEYQTILDVKDYTVHCLEVEEDHSFIANGFTVHNCWMYSGTMCLMLVRATMNQPYVRLSAHAGACMIKNFVNEGGWGAQGLDWLVQKGQPSVAFWPEKSMSRSNNRPETWADAARYKVTEAWVDLAPPVYDRNLSEDQAMTCLLCRIPLIGDFMHWSHSVALMDPVQTAQLMTADPGSLDFNNPNDLAVFAAAFGKRGVNSWSDAWGNLGEFVLQGSKAILDGGAALRVALAA